MTHDNDPYRAPLAQGSPSRSGLPPHLDEDGDPVLPRRPRKRSGGFPFLACGCLGVAAVAIAGFVVMSIAGTAMITLTEAGLGGSSSLALGTGPVVGVVRLEGPITDSKPFAKQMAAIRKSSRIKALVVRVDTPGGAVGASEEIWRDILSYRSQTSVPVVVSMGNAAASGGFYVAMASDTIIANSGTITGSIGVIVQGFGFAPLLERAGLEGRTIKSGEMKDAGSPFRPLETEERAYFQGVVYDMYRQFFLRVLTARWQAMDKAMKADPDALDRIVMADRTKRTGAGLEWDAFTTGSMAKKAGAPVAVETALRRLADGRILTGEQALEVGLVDKLGGLQDAVAEAGRKAGLKPGEWTVYDPEPKTGLGALFGAATRDALQEAAQSAMKVEFR